ncbi:hypothetical protein PPERSA_12981 [Pseudocohnilembus persalinus]|uniref:Uncharacterized protein n=1 Tax=Pseudocohnilembus persalinus TaxID=266149 RepID=A0A0V0R1U2_PSEPJ|nr:hypothetical protein PPERSA_12981 [Pseudocohnilembus persalinus]|eukprot:KRX08500.1 hypothetical protein PPERSA_12981 [Pseudocohnilembus persalinus]
MYKLQFLSGKTLIICPDQSSVYKMFLFLQRIGAKGFQVLNDTDPKNLRYYVMSMFNTGVIQTMITTEKVFEDLRKKVFYTKKRKILQFKNLGNIIFMDLKNVKDIYNNMYTHFRGSEGTIISLLDQSEQQVEILTNLIEQQKKQFTQINIKEFPLKKHEIDSFRYRISDVVGAISRKQVKNMQMLDFKKKLLKSKELETYFRENDADRQLIIEDINSLSKQIHQYQVKCEDEIPEYLVPEMVKEQRKRFNDKKEKFSKIQVTRTNEEFQKSLKRRMEKNNLTLDDVKKKKVLDQAGDKFVVVNNEKEAVDGDEVDANRLKVISGRKLWKIKHGFKLHKKNKRMEKKGIYQA